MSWATLTLLALLTPLLSFTGNTSFQMSIPNVAEVLVPKQEPFNACVLNIYSVPLECISESTHTKSKEYFKKYQKKEENL